MGYDFNQCKIDFLHLASYNLQYAFAKGVAMFLFQDLPAPSKPILEAKAGNSATSSWTTGIDSSIHPQSVQVVFGDGWDGGDVTITGLDQFGRAQTETVADVNNTTVQGTKVWDIITTIAKQSVGVSAVTMTVQTGANHYGLPVPLLGAWGMGTVDGIAELFSFNATANSFKPATAPNDARDFVVVSPVDWAAYEKMYRYEPVNASESPSASPSLSPSVSPSASQSLSPSASPSISPSKSPSKSPSLSPSASPSLSPSASPSVSPS